MDRPGTTKSQRGAALILSLLVLVVISVLGLIIMSTLNTDTKLVGHSVRYSQALNTAEAGVAEALAQIRRGEVPNTGSNPRMVAQIFLSSAGSVPVVGADTTALATAQPAGNWLAYSTPTKGPDVLKVEYKTNPDRTAIYRYDPALNPAVQTLSGVPVFTVTSTGRQGNDVRRIVTEVCQRPVNVTVYAALAANADIKFSGNSVVCGYNHRGDTPTDKGTSGRVGPGGCNENPMASPPEWETGLLWSMPGVYTPFGISAGGASAQYGDPPIVTSAAGFYAGPWEALGMSQAEFFAWIGPPLSTAPAGAQGVYYLDNNAIQQDRTGDFAYHGGNGEGLLYVDGDLTLNGDFTYRGMIYAEGDVKLNGNAWILGAVIARGRSEVKLTGGLTLLYSRDAVLEKIAKHAGQFVTLSWRESN